MGFGTYDEGDIVLIGEDCMYDLLRGKNGIILEDKGDKRSTVTVWFPEMKRYEDVCHFGTRLHDCNQREARYIGKCLYLHKNDITLEGFWWLE